jgi:hypothetical protein
MLTMTALEMLSFSSEAMNSSQRESLAWVSNEFISIMLSAPMLDHGGFGTTKTIDNSFQKSLLLPHLIVNSLKAVPVYRVGWRDGGCPGRSARARAESSGRICFDQLFEDGSSRTAYVDGGLRGAQNLNDPEYKVVVERRPAVIELHEVLHGGEGILGKGERHGRVEWRGRGLLRGCSRETRI